MFDQFPGIRPLANAAIWLALLGAVVAQTAGAQEVEPALKKKVFQEYRPSLKDGAKNERFQLMGPDADECVKFDDAGLRITLPTEYVGSRPETGIRVDVEIKGDFEITMSFDILHEPGPKDKGYARTTLGIRCDAAPQESRDATTSRLRNAKGATQFAGWAPPLLDDAGVKIPRIKYAPTQTKSGRLRLVRVGSELSYYVSEGADAEFNLLTKYAMSTENVSKVRMVGATDGPKASLDVRITDLVIRAESFPDPPAELMNHPAVPNAEVAAANSTFLEWPVIAFLLGAGFLLLVVLILGLWLYSRQRRGAAGNTQAESVAASLSFPCSVCGRKLTVKTELAGKKVKCARCGAIALAARS